MGMGHGDGAAARIRSGSFKSGADPVRIRPDPATVAAHIMRVESSRVESESSRVDHLTGYRHLQIQVAMVTSR